MVFVYLFLLLSALLGAYGSSLVNTTGDKLGIIYILIAGLFSTLLWCISIKTYHSNLVVANVIWDALYALSYTIGIYYFIQSSLTPTQITGIVCIIGGILLVNCK